MIRFLSFCCLLGFISCAPSLTPRIKPVGLLTPPAYVKLPPELKEISGLCFVGDKLYALNDGGNPATLYEMGEDGSIKKRIQFPETNNTDWEELTAGATHFYLGDFGNNLGSRRDLAIYRFPIQAIEDEKVTAEELETISIKYAAQNSFVPSSSHAFDMEAMVVRGDSLHLFSKNRQSGWSQHYVLPAVAGEHLLYAADSFYTGKFLITGAAFSGTNLVLTAYKRKRPEVALFISRYWKGRFTTPPQLYFLPGLKKSGQLESAAFKTPYDLVLANEGIRLGNLFIPNRLAFMRFMW